MNHTPDTPPLMAQPMITNGERSLGLNRGSQWLVLDGHELDRIQELLNDPARWPTLIQLSGVGAVDLTPAEPIMLDGTVEPAEPRPALIDKDGEKWVRHPDGWRWSFDFPARSWPYMLETYGPVKAKPNERDKPADRGNFPERDEVDPTLPAATLEGDSDAPTVACGTYQRSYNVSLDACAQCGQPRSAHVAVAVSTGPFTPLAVQAQPRVWHTDDPEPVDVRIVAGPEGGQWHRRATGWCYCLVNGRPQGECSNAVDWTDLPFPLTEALSDATQGAP